MTLANGDSAEYFAAAAEGRLSLQQCSHCEAIQFPPRHHCAECWEAELNWVDATGKGKVETFTIVRRAPLPQYREKVPYAVVSVILEEGPRMIATLVGDDALDVKIGDEVKAVFQQVKDGETLPEFQRV